MDHNTYGKIQEPEIFANLESKFHGSKKICISVTKKIAKIFEELKKENDVNIKNAEEYIIKLYSELMENGLFDGTYNEFKEKYFKNK